MEEAGEARKVETMWPPLMMLKRLEMRRAAGSRREEEVAAASVLSACPIWASSLLGTNTEEGPWASNLPENGLADLYLLLEALQQLLLALDPPLQVSQLDPAGGQVRYQGGQATLKSGTKT